MNDDPHNDIDQICARFWQTPRVDQVPHSPPLYLSTVFACDSTEQARQMLAGRQPGYVYQRDGHPNGDMLAERCRLLHAAEWALVTSSGMGALAAVVLAECQAGDHLLVGQDLYGRSLDLLSGEAARLGIECELVDTSNVAAVAQKMRPETRLVVAETISNPLLKVADIPELAQLCHRHGARLLVDNTFASPWCCRPLKLGADLVIESMTKIMNGHADGLLGLVCGRSGDAAQVKRMTSIWGLTASAFDCWLVARGLSTLHLRSERAVANAQQVARFLAQHPKVEGALYPHLATHPDHAVAARMLGDHCGTVVTFTLKAAAGEDPLAAAERFIQAAAPTIPFCPTLGDLSTSLTHPASTSHRNLTPDELARLGISPATIRLSVGIESAGHLEKVLAEALQAA